MAGINQLLGRHAAGARMIESDAAVFQTGHQTIEQDKRALLCCQLTQLVVAEEADMEDHTVATQTEQPLNRLPFVFGAVAALGHQ